MPARLLLLYVLFRSSWLTVEGGRGRRRHRAASPGRTGSRGRVGRRGWWRSDAVATRAWATTAPIVGERQSALLAEGRLRAERASILRPPGCSCLAPGGPPSRVIALMTKKQRARRVGWLVHVVHSGRHRQRGVRFTRRGSRQDARIRRRRLAAVVRVAVGWSCCRSPSPPTRRSLPSPVGYTRYKNVYMADGPVWAQSARQ